MKVTPTGLRKPAPCFGWADWERPSALRNIPYPRELCGNLGFPGLDGNGIISFQEMGKSPQRYIKIIILQIISSNLNNSFQQSFTTKSAPTINSRHTLTMQVHFLEREGKWTFYEKLLVRSGPYQTPPEKSE